MDAPTQPRFRVDFGSFFTRLQSLPLALKSFHDSTLKLPWRKFRTVSLTLLALGLGLAANELADRKAQKAWLASHPVSQSLFERILTTHHYVRLTDRKLLKQWIPLIRGLAPVRGADDVFLLEPAWIIVRFENGSPEVYQYGTAPPPIEPQSLTPDHWTKLGYGWQGLDALSARLERGPLLPEKTGSSRSATENLRFSDPRALQY